MPELNIDEIAEHTDDNTSCAICDKEYNVHNSHPIAPEICGECWAEIDPHFSPDNRYIAL
tara:strand:+ start:1263 stop:1442 length:180 start_codon:yes stop_codon:yes gene_type:complete